MPKKQGVYSAVHVGGTGATFGTEHSHFSNDPLAFQDKKASSLGWSRGPKDPAAAARTALHVQNRGQREPSTSTTEDEFGDSQFYQPPSHYRTPGVSAEPVADYRMENPMQFHSERKKFLESHPIDARQAHQVPPTSETHLNSPGIPMQSYYAEPARRSSPVKKVPLPNRTVMIHRAGSGSRTDGDASRCAPADLDLDVPFSFSRRAGTSYAAPVSGGRKGVARQRDTAHTGSVGWFGCDGVELPAGSAEAHMDPFGRRLDPAYAN